MERAVVTIDLKSHNGRKHGGRKVWGYFRMLCAFILVWILGGGVLQTAQICRRS